MNENKKRRAKLIAELEWRKVHYGILEWINSPNRVSLSLEIRALERSIFNLDRRKRKRNQCECKPKKISTKRLGMQVCNKECKPKQQSALGMQVSNKEKLMAAAKVFNPLSAALNKKQS